MKACHNCFKVLSEKNRMIIIDLLKKGAQKASDIEKHLNVSQPTISHHLKTLKEESLIIPTRKGREIFYRFNKKYPCRSCKLYDNIRL